MSEPNSIVARAGLRTAPVDGHLRVHDDSHDNREVDDVPEEHDWCVYPLPRHECTARKDDDDGAICVSRWHDSRSGRGVTARVRDDTLLVMVNMRPSRGALCVNGMTTQCGPLVRGDVRVFAPGTRLSMEWDAPCDALHLHCPIALLHTLGERDGTLVTLRSDVATQTVLQRDHSILALAECMIAPGLGRSHFSRSFRDSVATAIVSRVMHQLRPVPPLTGARTPIRSQAPSATTSHISVLQSWRLDRVFEHVEAHLHERVSLIDMADASGLSRMHFARLFRAATGRTPAAYLLHRRMVRARDALGNPDTPIIDIALNCGFQSQSHFTTVFKREAGMTPHAWRTLRKRNAAA